MPRIYTSGVIASVANDEGAVAFAYRGREWPIYEFMASAVREEEPSRNSDSAITAIVLCSLPLPALISARSIGHFPEAPERLLALIWREGHERLQGSGSQTTFEFI